MDYMNASIRYVVKRAQLIEDARNQPCTDCNTRYPSYVIDLHHLDPSTKSFALSQWHTKGIQTIKDELAKCIPLCANCHRIRTHGTSE